MSRLIVVSNRVPSSAAEPCGGGLAVALEAALSERGGMWLGWSGRTAETPDPVATVTGANRFDLATIDLTPQELRGYYEQHANRALWPLFHSRIDLASFDYESHALYRKVNRRFAAALDGFLARDDLVWVHDYHLIPLGAELRRLGHTGPVGFFLHIPFPGPEALAALPWQSDLLDDLAAYDTVGFQTAEAVRNFREALERRAAAKGGGRISATSLSARAGHFPIGIDTRGFAGLAASPAVQSLCERLRAVIGGQIWIAGVERLDYTKGLPQRFRAFETLLDEAPELKGRVSIVQVAAPSREAVPEYQLARRELEALSGRINARFGRLDWTPIRYFNQAFDRCQVAALYRVSRVGVVTPLRDGMNMVAKEYVAAQDPEDPGCLVLSRFAGAAEELSEALLVNPHDTLAVARALRAALAMPQEERRLRWSRMMRHIEREDVHRWCRRFLESLSGTTSRPQAVAAAAVA